MALTEEKVLEIAKPVVKEVANRIVTKRYEDVEEVAEFVHFSAEHLKHIIEGQMQENEVFHLDQVEEEDLVADENIFCDEIFENGKGFRISYQFSEAEEVCSVYLELQFSYTDTNEWKVEIPISEDMAVEMTKPYLKKIVNLIAEKRYEEVEQIVEMGQLTSKKMKEILEGYLEENDLPDHIDPFSDKNYYDMYDEEVSGGVYEGNKGIWIEYHFYTEGESTDLLMKLDFLFTNDANMLKPVVCGFDID